jgi:hypothetical protein
MGRVWLDGLGGLRRGGKKIGRLGEAGVKTGFRPIRLRENSKYFFETLYK